MIVVGIYFGEQIDNLRNLKDETFEHLKKVFKLYLTLTLHIEDLLLHLDQSINTKKNEKISKQRFRI